MEWFQSLSNPRTTVNPIPYPSGHASGQAFSTQNYPEYQIILQTLIKMY